MFSFIPPLLSPLFAQLHKHKFFNFVQLTFSALVSVSINCSIFPQTLFVLIFSLFQFSSAFFMKFTARVAVSTLVYRSADIYFVEL